MLFSRENAEEVDFIKNILSSYQKASDQMVNIDKSKVSFSGNVGEGPKEMICARLGFRGVIRHSRNIINVGKFLVGFKRWRKENLLDELGNIVSRKGGGRFGFQGYPRLQLKSTGKAILETYANRWFVIREVLQMQMKDSNGKRVDIWKDNWIPNVLGFKHFSPARVLEPDSKDCNLIDVDLGMLLEDKAIWHFEKDGEYYVKTTYHLLGDLTHAGKPVPSTRVRQKVWKNLWNVSVNERIKNFTWRFVKEILPTKANLSKQGVFFSSPLGVRVPASCDVLDWISNSVLNKESVVGQTVMTVMWKIWQARNNVVFNSASPDTRAVAQEIWESTEEADVMYGRCSSKDLLIGNGKHVTNSWIVQSDAGCFSDGIFSLGCVIKDLIANIFLAASSRLSNHVDASDEESNYGGSVAEVKCDVDKWGYFEVLWILKELGHEESGTIIYKDPTVGFFTLSDVKVPKRYLIYVSKVVVNVDETKDVIGKLVEDVLNDKAGGVSDLNKAEVGGKNVDVKGVEHMSEGEVRDINVDVNGPENMSEGEVGDNNIDVNGVEDMSEGEVGDNNVDVNGDKDMSDSDNVSFQYDNALDVFFQDSDEDNDGLVEEDITHLLGYDKEAEGL
ncbi:hypothetical protein KIW84_042542 [Lathyrus oleraceus]|uniref:Uncharacterized protein n=1 Tax=Pisum sativum TaxID=3888 RepID=A0A9D4XFT7_PEA|nr:hypothetical protein KIW84_042542 [Pisum sativum]